MNKDNKNKSDLLTLLGLMIVAIAIMWDPSYRTQELNLFEWGLYLPGIDAVTKGQVPYVDFYHLRGPFELYVPAIFMKIFGFRADVLASYFYFGTMLTVLVAVLIAYELIFQRYLLYAFVMVLVTRTFPRVVFTFWGGMRYAWGLLAVWCIIRFFKSKHLGWLLAAGCLTAISAWTSLEVGISLVIAFLVALLFTREYYRWAAVFGAGILVITLPYVIYLLSQNAWTSYWQAQWVVVTQMQNVFIQIAPVPHTFFKFVHAIFIPMDRKFYQMTPMYCYMFFFFLYIWRLFNKKSSAIDHGVMVLVVYSFMLFLTGFRNLSGSVFEMSLQPEKVVLFYLLGQLIQWAQQKLPRFKWVATILIAAVIISSAIYVIDRIKTRFYKVSWVNHLIKGQGDGEGEMINGSPAIPVDLPRIKHMVIPVGQAEDLVQLTHFVDEHVRVDEAVWMYPELGTLNFILHRPWVGRFPMATLSWMNEEWFAEYEDALEHHPPRYAIVNKVMPFYFDKIYFLVPANRMKHEQMMQFLYNHYVIEAQTPNYFVYKRVKI